MEPTFDDLCGGTDNKMARPPTRKELENALDRACRKLETMAPYLMGEAMIEEDAHRNWKEWRQWFLRSGE